MVAFYLFAKQEILRKDEVLRLIEKRGDPSGNGHKENSPILFTPIGNPIYDCLLDGKRLYTEWNSKVESQKM